MKKATHNYRELFCSNRVGLHPTRRDLLAGTLPLPLGVPWPTDGPLTPRPRPVVGTSGPPRVFWE